MLVGGKYRGAQEQFSTEILISGICGTSIHMSFHLVPAEPDDAAIVRRIMQEAFAEYEDVLRPPSGSHRETVEQVEAAIKEGGAVLVWDGTQPVGSARYLLEEGALYVGRVSVLPSHRRRGIATLIMAWMERRALELGVSRVRVGVRMSLPSNVELYRRLGYRLIAVEEHPRGPDRVGTLVKELHPPANVDPAV
jgi:GNAT superfamily N-acetyltransferase